MNILVIFSFPFFFFYLNENLNLVSVIHELVGQGPSIAKFTGAGSTGSKLTFLAPCPLTNRDITVLIYNLSLSF